MIVESGTNIYIHINLYKYILDAKNTLHTQNTVITRVLSCLMASDAIPLFVTNYPFDCKVIIRGLSSCDADDIHVCKFFCTSLDIHIRFMLIFKHLPTVLVIDSHHCPTTT